MTNFTLQVVFSVVMDETIGQSAIKQCAFTVIYYDGDVNNIKTTFFDTATPSSGTAEDLHNCLKFSEQRYSAF